MFQENWTPSLSVVTKYFSRRILNNSNQTSLFCCYQEWYKVSISSELPPVFKVSVSPDIVSSGHLSDTLLLLQAPPSQHSAAILSYLPNWLRQEMKPGRRQLVGSLEAKWLLGKWNVRVNPLVHTWDSISQSGLIFYAIQGKIWYLGSIFPLMNSRIYLWDEVLIIHEKQ